MDQDSRRRWSLRRCAAWQRGTRVRAAVVSALIIVLAGCARMLADVDWVATHMGHPGIPDTVALECPAAPPAPGPFARRVTLAVDDARAAGDTVYLNVFENYRTHHTVFGTDTTWVTDSVPAVWRSPVPVRLREVIAARLRARAIAAADSEGALPRLAITLRELRGFTTGSVGTHSHRRAHGRTELVGMLTTGPESRAVLPVTVEFAENIQSVSSRNAVRLAVASLCTAAQRLALAVDSVLGAPPPQP